MPHPALPIDISLQSVPSGKTVALWSHYDGAGDAVSFVRVGTLDHPDRVPPDIHIFTESKQP